MGFDPWRTAGTLKEESGVPPSKKNKKKKKEHGAAFLTAACRGGGLLAEGMKEGERIVGDFPSPQIEPLTKEIPQLSKGTFWGKEGLTFFPRINKRPGTRRKTYLITGEKKRKESAKQTGGEKWEYLNLPRTIEKRAISGRRGDASPLQIAEGVQK